MPIRAQAAGSPVPPRLASGRPRAAHSRSGPDRTGTPVGRGRCRPRVGSDPVTLLRRHPRELYRVYAEEEFFAGARTGEGLSGELTPPQLEDRRRRRLAGAVLLAGGGGQGGGGGVVNPRPRPRRGGGGGGARGAGWS